MTATLRIPTKEQYAYIEVKVEGTAEEIIKQYFDLTKAYWDLVKEIEKNKPPF